MVSLAGLMGLVGFGATRSAETDTPTVEVEHVSPIATSDEVEQGHNSDLFDPIAVAETMRQVDLTDQRVLDAVMSDGQTTAISDFTPEDDSLLFVWDDSDDEDEPHDVSVQCDPLHAGEVQVWFGDQVIAQISGPAALMDVDIAMIPFSSAQALELLEA